MELGLEMHERLIQHSAACPPSPGKQVYLKAVSKFRLFYHLTYGDLRGRGKRPSISASFIGHVSSGNGRCAQHVRQQLYLNARRAFAASSGARVWSLRRCRCCVLFFEFSVQMRGWTVDGILRDALKLFVY